MTSTATYPTISNWLDRNHAISSNIRKQLTKKNSLQNVLRITWKHRDFK